MYRAIGLLLVPLALLVSAPIIASPVAKGGFGMITGTLTDAETDAPIDGCFVDYMDLDGTFRGNAFTNLDGEYTMFSVPVGTYLIRTACDAAPNLDRRVYLDEISGDIPCYLRQCDLADGESLEVTTDATTTVDIDLMRGGVIQGRVVSDVDGSPLEGVLVRILDPETGNDLSGRASLTNANGEYTSRGLISGEYRLGADTSSDGVGNAMLHVTEIYPEVQCPGCDRLGGTIIAVTVGEATSGIDFSLELGGRIAGTVTDSLGGASADGRFVDVYDEAGNYATFGWVNLRICCFGRAGLSGTSKQYSTVAIPAGTYFVRTNAGFAGLADELHEDQLCIDPFFGACDVTTGTPVELAPGETETIDFSLEFAGTVSGTITDSRDMQPLSFQRVDAFDMAGRLVTTGFNDFDGGDYTVGGLAPGQYYLVTDAGYPLVDEVWDNVVCPRSTCDPTAGGTLIEVVSQAETRVDFELDPGGALGGLVRDAVTGEPLAGVEVLTVDGAGTVVSRARTVGIGRYFTDTLPPATYFAVTNAASRGFFDQIFVGLTCLPGFCLPNALLGDPIVVDENTFLPIIDFDLRPGGILRPLDLGAADQLGTAIAADGNVLIIGVPGDDGMMGRSGAALVYRREGSGYVFVDRLTAPNGVTGDLFGFSAAIAGDLVAIGAPGTVDQAKGAAPLLNKSTYVYRLSGGNVDFVQQLASENLGTASGFASSIAVDGNTLVVGAPNAPIGSGAAVVYDFDGAAFNQTATLFDPAGQPGEGFGASVSIDNDRIVIGTPLGTVPQTAITAGIAELYSRLPGTGDWQSVGKFSGPDPADGDGFGTSVALTGRRFAVGAPGADVDGAADAGRAQVFSFDPAGNVVSRIELTPSVRAAGDRFGEAVAFDGQRAVVGATGGDGAQADAGAVFVFADAGGEFVETELLTLPQGQSGDAFGKSVAVAGDVVAVGAPEAADAAGAAAVFTGADVLFLAGGFEG